MSRLVVAVVAACVVLLGTPAAAAAQQPGVHYIPPADAPLVDVFRPPGTDFGAGNRGIDYGTDRGDLVLAAADGIVVFAGQVGGSMHVVVLHADGIRTSYSFLERVHVRRGDRVRAGDQVGTANGPFHFGARAGSAYLDPAVLLEGGQGHVRLVPDDLRRPLPELAERSLLTKFLGGVRAGGLGVVRAGDAAVTWVRDGAATGLAAGTRAATMTVDEMRVWLHYARSLGLAFPEAIRIMVVATAWQMAPCTAASVPTPRLRERRIVVLVAGLGSESGGGGVMEVDTAGLGYAVADTHQFSYRGGTAKQNPYKSSDTYGDLSAAGVRLRTLIRDLERANPGVPIDVIAHSQGGLVARSALADLADELGPTQVDKLVTLASPHSGSDAATTIAMITSTSAGQAAVSAAKGISKVPPDAIAAGQLIETSGLVDDLGDRDLPPGVEVISIAARRDLIVPSPRSHLGGARNVTVTVDGAITDQHSALPGSPAAHREMALALAGMPPACESLLSALTDAAEGEMVSYIEDAIGALGNLVGRALGGPAPRRRATPERRLHGAAP